VLLTSCDVHRPAAIDQLAVLAREIGVDCFPADLKDGAVAIAEAALRQARKGFYDVFIVDTAGRLAAR
jgi:signal recognition particle subunit SRP54